MHGVISRPPSWVDFALVILMTQNGFAVLIIAWEYWRMRLDVRGQTVKRRLLVYALFQTCLFLGMSIQVCTRVLFIEQVSPSIMRWMSYAQLSASTLTSLVAAWLIAQAVHQNLFPARGFEGTSGNGHEQV